MVVGNIHIELHIVTALQRMHNTNLGNGVDELGNRSIVHILAEGSDYLVIQILHKVCMAPDDVCGVLTLIEGESHQLLLSGIGLQQLDFCKFHFSSSSVSSTTTYR